MFPASTPEINERDTSISTLLYGCSCWARCIGNTHYPLLRWAEPLLELIQREHRVIKDR